MTPDGFDNFDQLLRIFGSQNRGMLRLEAGSPARIIGADGDSQDVSERMLTRQEILAMVSPIVPEHARRQLPKEPSVSFDYMSPSVGPFKLTMARDTERLIVTVVSENPGDPEPEVPEPSPVEKPAPPPVLAVAPPTPAIVAGPPIDRLFRAHGGRRRVGPSPFGRDAAARA